MTADDSGEGETRTLSTGHEVTLPLDTEATAAGVVLTADATRVREELPTPLAPVRVAPGRAPVVLVGVSYRRVGDDAMAPYDEFGVLLPAAPARGGPFSPERATLRGDVGAYVWWLPVTSDPGRALGVELWDYPKTVLDVRIDDRDGRRRVTVSESKSGSKSESGDGERVVTFSVRRPPTVRTRIRTVSYAGEDPVRRIPHGLEGQFGAWPLTDEARVSLGEHSQADRLRAMGLATEGRVLARIWFDGQFVVGRGASVSDGFDGQDSL